jgi:hypothetical protein
MFHNGTDFRLGYQVGCVKKAIIQGMAKFTLHPLIHTLLVLIVTQNIVGS